MGLALKRGWCWGISLRFCLDCIQRIDDQVYYVIRVAELIEDCPGTGGIS